jgi:hypothetical protein
MVGPEGRLLHPDTITARSTGWMIGQVFPGAGCMTCATSTTTMAQDAGHNLTIGALIAQAAGSAAPESDPLVTDLVTDRPNTDPDDGDQPSVVVG